jgi:hypothetical protein
MASTLLQQLCLEQRLPEWGWHRKEMRVWTPQEERLFQEIGRRLEDALTSLLMLRHLRESERKLEEAQRLAHVGCWERDPETDRITWSDETYCPPTSICVTISADSCARA